MSEVQEKGVSEEPLYFKPRGFGRYAGVCFLTGAKPGSNDAWPCIPFFVKNLDEGKKIVQMFGGYAQLEHDKKLSTPPVVTISVQPEFSRLLSDLHAAVHAAGDRISPAIIAEIKKEFTPKAVSGVGVLIVEKPAFTQGD